LSPLDRAAALHAAGRLPEAEIAYKKALEERPDELNALLGLAQLFMEQGKPQKAAALLQRELGQLVERAEVYLAYGTALAAQGKVKEAIPSFERAVALAPALPQSHFYLGRALHEDGQVERAVDSYRRALTAAPHVPELHYAIANAFAAMSQWVHAEQHYQTALNLQPDLGGARINLGNVLKAQQRFAEARAVYEEAVRLHADSADAQYNLGTLLLIEGDSYKAVSHLQAALTLRPGWPEAANNLANALRAKEGPIAALKWFELALRQNPKLFDAHYNLGATFEELRRYDKALESYSNALRLRPSSADALEKVVAAKLFLCQWLNLDELVERLRALGPDGNDLRPFTYLALPAVTRREQRFVAERYAKEQARGLSYVPPPTLVRQSGDKPLRIAYLSGDYHEHATSHLMVEVFERHDRQRFETIAYSYGPDDGSSMRSRLASAFDRFVDVRDKSVRDLASTISRDGVNILIDLKGYTERHKARVLALRPALLQVSYLGYPGTMGADFIDYLVADPRLIPEEHVDDYKEAIAWLPHCYQPNDSHRSQKSMPDRPSCRLPESAFVFCCLNQSYKINAATFAIWCRLLARIPFSVLWLLRGHPQMEVNLRGEAKRRGIREDRLIFAERVPQIEHLARLQQADLFLDTTPYGAHTLASDALWAGVPIVTFLGETFASRVAASLLSELGLDELITHSADEYEQKAYELATDTGRRSALRQLLKQQSTQSALFNGARVAKNLERLYEKMWHRRLSGLPPAHISLEED
jgi:protein O-GlcNAc transferase